MINITYLLNQINIKKDRLDKLRPLSVWQVKNLKAFIDVDYTYNSNAIEGNTLTYSETKLVLNEGLTIGGKSLNEHLEVINHKEAIDFIEELSSDINFTLKDIKDIHSIILRGIDNPNAGRFRDIEVGVRKSSGEIQKFCSPLKIDENMRDFILWLEENRLDIPIKASLAHLKFVSIHPFTDGNGRTARLLMNLILLQNQYPITIIELKNRVEYIKAIESYQESGDETLFINFVLKGLNSSLDKILDIVENNIKIL